MANYKFAIPYFLKKEGKLSKAQTDSAKKNSSPCKYNGSYGYHTNKGVTYSTFINLATKLNYTANCDNFLTMPSIIWNKIFKIGYWDFWKCDDIPYQSIADFMTWSVWGSGGGSWSKKNGSIGFLYNFLKSKNILTISKNDIRDKLLILAEKNEEKLWFELIQFRYNWYSKLNQPANLKGWRNSLENYKNWGENKYTFDKKQNFYIKPIIGVLLLIAAYNLYKG